MAPHVARLALAAQLRTKAEPEGLDPNVRSNNVEIAAAQEIGPVTVTCVSNIYKYCFGYKKAIEAVSSSKRTAGRTQLSPST